MSTKMEINFNNSSIINLQNGNKNKMYINNNSCHSVIRDENWKELNSILNEKLMANSLSKPQSVLTNKALEYVKRKDEQGFKNFWIANKDNLLTNIFSNLASSGLLELLNHL